MSFFPLSLHALLSPYLSPCPSHPIPLSFAFSKWLLLLFCFIHRCSKHSAGWGALCLVSGASVQPLLFHGANWFQASLLSSDHGVLARGACFLARSRKSRASAPRMISCRRHFLKGGIASQAHLRGTSSLSLPASLPAQSSCVRK